jgi:Flp pilus assembly protein TadD
VASLRRRPAVAVGALWFVLQLLPTNSLVARPDVASERQLYLAAFGPFLLAGLVAQASARRRPTTVLATALVLVLLSGLTVRRNRDYRSGVALWASAVRLDPGNARAFNNLGFEWQRQGCAAEARAAYEEALRLRPDYPKARANVAALEQAGDIGPCRAE